VILCPRDIVSTTCGVGELVNYPSPVVTGVTPGDYTLICTPPSGSFFPVGTNKVVCCAFDRCGRNTCCEFNVTIPKGITYAGNQHCPLGVATLTRNVAGDTLVLDNITETGLDGVQIALGAADFCEVVSPFMAMPEDSCRYQYRAVVDGVADRTAAVLSVSGNAAGEMLFTGDMSGLGATRYTVLVLDGVTQVASLSNQPVANVSVSGEAVSMAPSLRWDIKTYKCYIRIKLPKLPGNPGPLIRLAAGLAVNGDNVIILPEDPTRSLGAQNRLLLTATAVRPMPKVLLSEELGLFGLGHTGLGDATLAANGGTLTVGNLGISGNNGVAIDLERSEDFLASLLDVTSAQGPRPHPWFQARAFGQFGDVVNHDLGSLRFMDAGVPAVQLEADFSPVGASTHTIEVWQSGQLVRRITGHSGIVGTLNVWPSGIGKLGGAGADSALTLWARFTGGVRVSIAGGPTLDGDELRVLAESPSSPIGAVRSLHLQGTFESFTIVNETSTPALTPRLGNIGPAPGGGLQLTIPTAFGYKYTVESVNALGPQPVPWSPFKTFAGDGSLTTVPLESPYATEQFYRLRVDNPFGLPGGEPIPDFMFPHKIFMFLDNITVNEARNQDGDRPYFITILFQTQLNTPGSTTVRVVESEPHDWVAKDNNPILLGGADRMRPGKSLPIPKWMGTFQWENIQWNTMQGLTSQCLQDPQCAQDPNTFKPQIMLMGAAVMALDNHNTPPHMLRDLVNRLANGLKQELVAQVETGNIMNGLMLLFILNPPQALNALQDRLKQLADDAAQRMKLDFWDALGVLIGSLCDPDMPVGANVMLFPALPGIPQVSSTNEFPFPIVNCSGPTGFGSVGVQTLVRPPDNFATTLPFVGMGAVYRVNARMVPDFVPPPPPPNQPDPYVATIVRISVHTGGDNLNSDSTAQATITIKNRSPETFNLNFPNQGFDDYKDNPQNQRDFPLSSPAPYLDLLSITVRVVQQDPNCNAFCDNWNVDGLVVECFVPKTGRFEPLLAAGGTPLVRLVAKDEHPEKNEFRQKTFPFTH